MKILWVEDGGGNLQMSKAMIDLFGDMIPKKTFAKEYDEDEAPEIELPRLFLNHTSHEIVLCRSYDDWRWLDEEDAVDFDVAILDINLEARPTSDPPLDVKDFDRKAGLFIYLELIRSHRFPDENIAFFTGEKGTLKGFRDSCTDGMLPPPAHCFEKKQMDFQRIRAWLKEREVSPYLRLRRAVRDGCSYLLEQLEDTPSEELPSCFPLFRSWDPSRKFDRDAYRDRVHRHVFRLEHFLPMQSPADLPSFYGRCLADLTSPWGAVEDPTLEPAPAELGGSGARDLFARSRPRLLGLLHDWASRNLLSEALGEAEVAFAFLIVGRAWMAWGSDDLANYERQLLELLGKPNDGMDQWIEGELSGLLERAFNVLASAVERSPNRPVDFLELCRQFGKKTESFSPEERAQAFEVMREQGFELLYQAYWHGLAPTWIDPYTGKIFVSFDVEVIPPEGFHRELGRRLMGRSFTTLGTPDSSLTRHDPEPETDTEQNMKTPNDHCRSHDAQVEQGFIFSLMPEISRDIHTEGIAVVAHDMTTERLEVTAKCNFDFNAGDIAEQIWINIRKAEVIVADLTDYDPQVMFEVGISLGIKDAEENCPAARRRERSRNQNPRSTFGISRSPLTNETI